MNVVFRVLRGDVPGVLPLFSWVEIALGLAIVYPRTRRPGLTLGSALLMCYGAALVIVLRAGSNVSECRCLGAAIALDPTGHMLVLGGLLTCVGYATVLAECDGRVTFR